MNLAAESCQLVEQCLGVFQERRVEPLGEPIVYGREQVSGFGALALIAPQAGEAGGGA